MTTAVESVPPRFPVGERSVFSTARARRNRRDYYGVAVALGTTVLVNGLLVGLLAWLDRPRVVPPEAPVVIRRISIVPPKKLPTVATVRAPTPTPTPPSPVVAIALPAPAIVLPPMANGAVLNLPQLPVLDVARPVSMPAIVAALPAGNPGGVAPVADATELVEEAPVLTNGFDLERFYPRNARLRGIEGVSSMRLEIGSDGKVSACAIIAGDPPGVFDAAAKALCKTLRYTPARTHGSPVACAITLSVAWSLPR